MSDPFSPNSRDQLIREAQRGLVIVGTIFAIFIYVAFFRMTGRGEIPEHVRAAPTAQFVWPYDESVASRIASQADDRPMRDSAVELASHETTQTVDRSNRDSEPEFSSVRPSDRKPAQSKQNRYQEKNHSVVDREIELQPLPESPKPFPHSHRVQDEQPKALNDTFSFEPPKSSISSKQAEQTDDNPNDSELPVPVRSTSDFVPSDSPHPLLPWNNNSDGEFAFVRPPVKTPESVVGESDFVASPQGGFAVPEIRNVERNAPSVAPTIAQPSFDESESAAVAISPDITRAIAQHIVEEGDSFFSIAQKYYNDGRYFRALYEANVAVVSDFDSLTPGAKIGIPLVEDLLKLYPQLCPDLSDRVPKHFETKQADRRIPSSSRDESRDSVKFRRVHITRPGETLFDIAANRLGQASRYLELIELNASSLPKNTAHSTRLPANLKLVLPDK